MNDMQQQNETNKGFSQKMQSVCGAKRSPKLLISACAVVVSLVLLIMALCPLVTYKLTMSDDDETYSASTGVGAPQTIGYFFDSLQSKSEKELKNSPIFEQIEDLEEDFDDAYSNEDFDEEDLREMSVNMQEKEMFLLFRLSLQSSQIGPNIFSFASLFASLALILVCALMLVFSVSSVLKEWNGQDDAQSTKQHHLIFKLLVAIPMLFVLAFLLCLLGRSVNDIAMFSALYLTTKMAGTAIFAIVLSLAAIIAALVWKIKSGELKLEKTTVRRIVSATVAFTVICLTGASFFTVKIDEQFVNGSSDVRVPLKSDLFGMSFSVSSSVDFVNDFMNTSENGWTELVENRLNALGKYGTEFSEEDCETVVSLTLPVTAAAASEDTGASMAFNIMFYPIIIINLLIMLFSAAIFYADMSNVLTTNNDKKRHGGFRVWKHILIQLGILALFMLALNEGVFDSTDSIKVMLGSIGWIYPLTILSLIFRPRKAKKVETEV